MIDVDGLGDYLVHVNFPSVGNVLVLYVACANNNLRLMHFYLPVKVSDSLSCLVPVQEWHTYVHEDKSIILTRLLK